MATSDVRGFRCDPLMWALGLAIIVGLAPIATAEDRVPSQHGIAPIAASLCEEMKVRHVLNPGRPVGCERLKLIKFRYFGFDDRMHDDGEIVVMDAAAKHVLSIFAKLREMRFPIAKAKLMNHYNGNDDASMADNNTSGFNVREIAGGGATSLHAYGLAIDINPKQNPYAKRSGAILTFSPPSGIDYANRAVDRPWKAIRPGMAEKVVEVFANHGFLIWGGYWDDPIDYQHFQVNKNLAEQLARLTPAQAQEVFDRHVDKYLSCRRTSAGRGVSGRLKCIMADDPNGKQAGE